MRQRKHRRAQKRREKEQKSRSMVRLAVLGVSVIIVGIVFLLINNQEQATILENGRPIWHTMELTDARTGETFTLADFDERDVMVKITSLF